MAWYKKAAEQGHAAGQCFYGWCLHNGAGVEKNQQEGVAWYKKAAEQGHADGQFNYGWCLEYGAGMKQNISAAISWSQKAAKQGSQKAKKALKRLNR